LLGKLVLVGITYQDKRGEVKRYEQMHGVVVAVDSRNGVCLQLHGKRAGESKWFPPFTDIYQRAPKGEYRLHSTGEVVTDPDFTAKWTLTQPDA
jgi:hypothetical protein